MHSFTFNGVNSRQYCELFVSGGGTFNAPERDIESIPIPGRNGELTIDNGRFKNIKVEYPAWIAKDFYENSKKARAWLGSSSGYKKLEDDYHPDEFRMARFIDGLDFNTIADHVAGKTTVVFDCMPQRFLKSGETEITLDMIQLHTREGSPLLSSDEFALYVSSSSGYIINPTSFEALPLITVYGIGKCSIGIGSKTVLINDVKGSVIVDSATGLVYSGTTNYSNKMTGSFPVLTPGRNRIYISGGTTRISIIPRWWTL